MGEKIFLRSRGDSERLPRVSVRQLKKIAKPAVPVGQVAAKPKLGGLGIAAMVVAGVSLLGLITALATRPDGSFEEQVALLVEENAGLSRSFGKLQVEHAQLERSKAKLQRHLDSVQNDHEELIALFKRNSPALDKIQEKAAARETPPESSPPSGRLAPLTKSTGNASGHGSSCVCATCRKKKNGGSLFPDL